MLYDGFFEVFPFLVSGSNFSYKRLIVDGNALCPDAFPHQAASSDCYDNPLFVNLGQRFPVAQTKERHKPVYVQKTIAFTSTGQLLTAASSPFTGMVSYPGADLFEIDVAEAIPQVIAKINHGAVRTLCPESAALTLALALADVEVLRAFALQRCMIRLGSPRRSHMPRRWI